MLSARPKTVLELEQKLTTGTVKAAANATNVTVNLVTTWLKTSSLPENDIQSKVAHLY